MSNKREEINGPRKVQHGTIILKNIETAEQVSRILTDLAFEFPGCEYERSGVEGNYVIIERCGKPTTSRYI